MIWKFRPTPSGSEITPTVFSTIFLPLSFITGFFGMNLRSMPELTFPYGQELTILLMALVAATMLTLFKRRKWI